MPAGGARKGAGRPTLGDKPLVALCLARVEIDRAKWLKNKRETTGLSLSVLIRQALDKAFPMR
jgi:hypothetical protein